MVWDPHTGEDIEVEEINKPALWVKPTPKPVVKPVVKPAPIVKKVKAKHHEFSVAEAKLGGQNGKGKKKNVDPKVARDRAIKAAAARYDKNS